MQPKLVLDNALAQGLSLSFDDVTLLPEYSNFHPKETELQTLFSRNVSLNIPIVSAAMDTVTEYQMAIELAKEGGIGIIHKNLNPKDQAYQVGKVKGHLNACIGIPKVANSEETLSNLQERRSKEGYKFHSFPVLNAESKLIGILGEKSFQFGDSNQLIKDIMLEELVDAPSTTTTKEAYDIMKQRRIEALPLVDEKRIVTGMYVFSDVQRIIEGKAETYNINRGQLKVGAAIGVYDDAFERLEKLIKVNVDVIVIDTAHGNSKAVIDTLKKIKQEYDIDVVAGNISRGNAVKKLADAGADGIKVGQGSGSICTTRIIAGIGRAQISAIYDCAKQAKKYEIPICGDGGLVYPGDIPKAIAAGANSVMMGSMLAGVEESPGEKVFFNERTWKRFRGMGSLSALKTHQGSRERYNQSTKNEKGSVPKEKLVPEGIEGLEPYKGPLKDILTQYIGGLRSGMGYAGTRTINELRDKGDFDKVTSAALRESHPHNILITEKSPNYTPPQGKNKHDQ